MWTVGDRLVVTGDLDLAGRDAIGPALLAAAAGPAPCVVDLTAVRYLSSAGVALLAEAAALAGPRLSIVVASGSAPARVCALTGPAPRSPSTEAGHRRRRRTASPGGAGCLVQGNRSGARTGGRARCGVTIWFATPADDPTPARDAAPEREAT